MINKKTKSVWIVLGIFLVISMAGAFSQSAKEVGLIDTLGSFFVVTALVLGARYWILKSRK